MLITNIGACLSLIILFYILGKIADGVVTQIKHIAEHLGIKIFFLGLILGFLTSIPELTIGINAVIKDITDISLGNLLGGIIILFSLVLGGSAIVNRRLATDGKSSNMLLILGYTFLPLLFGLDGSINLIEALTLIIGYPLLIFYLYRGAKLHDETKQFTLKKIDFIKKVCFAIGGIALVILISNLIIRVTLLLLGNFKIPSFIVGLIFFSIGTNLPEIMITIRSWRKHIRDLSLSNLIGSAIANSFIIGILGVMKTIPVALNPGYYALIFLMLILFVILFEFYKRGEFTRREGFVLVGLYIIFIVSQAHFLFATK